MYILILNLIQTPQPPRISKLVWGGAILVLLIGVSLLVYFFSRLKKGEKEPEEDWSLARRSLFVEPAKPSDARSGVTETPVESELPLLELASPEPEHAALPAVGMSTPSTDEQVESDPIDAVQASDNVRPTVVLEAPESVAPTLALHSPEPIMPTLAEAPEPIAPAPPILEREPEPPPQERPLEERATELLVSSKSEEAQSEVEVFGEDVWAELDHKTAELQSEGDRVVRVERGAGREHFELPAIRPLVGREHFEPPRIERLVPGVTREQEIHPPSTSTSQQQEPQPTLLSDAVTEPSAVAPAAGGPQTSSARRKPAGSVLGLPVESSAGPLILGEPSRPRDEIGALSNYGKETGPDAGRGGTIVLLLTIVLVGGGILAYLYVPAVHAKIDEVISRLRGPSQTAATPAPEASGPRAQIFPARSEAVKNVVKARGAVYNTSSRPIDGLSVEVSLERGGDAPPDTRTIPVVPSRLEPRQQGRYEFEYDGSQETGYPSGYRVTKLLSTEGEIRFAAGAQPRPQ